MPARLLYARFAAAGDATALAWLRAAAETMADASRERFADQARLPMNEPAVGWRLVSENRRDVARSCRLFPDDEAACDHVVTLLRSPMPIETHLLPLRRLRDTGWFASLGDEPVMMCARRYDKRSTAESAAELAVRLLRSLEPVVLAAASG